MHSSHDGGDHAHVFRISLRGILLFTLTVFARHDEESIAAPNKHQRKGNGFSKRFNSAMCLPCSNKWGGLLFRSSIRNGFWQALCVPIKSSLNFCVFSSMFVARPYLWLMIDVRDNTLATSYRCIQHTIEGSLRRRYIDKTTRIFVYELTKAREREKKKSTGAALPDGVDAPDGSTVCLEDVYNGRGEFCATTQSTETNTI